MERLKDPGPYRWIGDNLDKLAPTSAPEWEGNRVSVCVPPVFAAYCKILHPIYERPSTDHGNPARNRVCGRKLFPNIMDRLAVMIPEGARRVRWAEMARRLGLVFHPEINENSLGRNFPGAWEGWHRHFVGPGETGSLDQGTCLRLVELLEPFVGGQACYFQYDHIATTALYLEPTLLHERYGLIYKGALDEVLAVSRLDTVRGTPSHWWSEDRSWCLNTDWDLSFTLVGGSERLVDALLSDEVLECLPVEPSSRVDSGSDRVNPSAACRARVSAPKREKVARGQGATEPVRVVPAGEDGVLTYHAFDPSVRRHEIYVIPASGGTPAKIPPVNELRNRYDPTYSPDGESISYRAWDSSSYQFRIYEIPVSGGHQRQLTHGVTGLRKHAYSPDGASIAYSARDVPRISEFNSTYFQIYTIPASGGAPTQITFEATPHHAPNFSPDGASIAYSARDGSRYQIYTIPASGGTPTKITSDDVDHFRPVFSPDGYKIAYVDDGQIYTVPSSGDGTPTKLDNADDRAYIYSLHWASTARAMPKPPSTAPAADVHVFTSRTGDTEPAIRATDAGTQNRRGSLEDIKRDFLLEGRNGDLIGLWRFGGWMRFVLGTEDDEEVKNASLKLVRELVGEELFVSGTSPYLGEFRPWDLGPEESIRAIERLWDDLGRDPNLVDDAPWFQATEKGKREGGKVAREHGRYNARGGGEGGRGMQRVDLIIPWRKDPIQLWMPKVTNTTGDGYSMTFEDEHGGEGKILFNQKSIAAVVISPPAGGPEQDAKTALREPERETAGPDLGEERGIAGRDNGAEPDLDTAQEPGTTQEPSPREEPPADPT